MVFGTVIIKPTNALVSQHKEYVDKIDPYVKVCLGKDYQKTDVAKKAGCNPIWNNEFVFKDVDLEKNVIRFEVWDHNFLKDSALGSCEYALSNLLPIQNHFNGGLILLYKGISAGTLYCDIQFLPELVSNVQTTVISSSVPTISSGMMGQGQMGDMNTCMDRGMSTGQQMGTKLGDQIYDMPQGGMTEGCSMNTQDVPMSDIMGQGLMGQNLASSSQPMMSGNQPMMSGNQPMMSGNKPGLIGRMEQGINETFGTNLGNQQQKKNY